MPRWVWVDAAVLRAVHASQLAEHGGAAGVRDDGLFASALARPLNLDNYAQPDAAALAAAYGYGIARNHPFVDGNKRLGHAATELYLLLNEHEIRATVDEQVDIVLGIAAGSVKRDEFVSWLASHVVPFERKNV